MLRLIALRILVTFTVFACQQNGEPPTGGLAERYRFYIHPSFHDGLSIIFTPETNHLLVQRHSARFVGDSVGRDGNYFEMIDSVRYEHIRPTLKPAFQIGVILSAAEGERFTRLMQALEPANRQRLTPGSGARDGTSFWLENWRGGDSTTYFLGSPRLKTPMGQAIVQLLGEVEAHYVNQDLVVAAIEHSSAQFHRQPFKVLSTQPLHVQLLAGAQYCEKLDSLVKQLPQGKEVFLDLTHYEGQDAAHMIEPFRKRYQHIRWIYKRVPCLEHKEIFNPE